MSEKKRDRPWHISIMFLLLIFLTLTITLLLSGGLALLLLRTGLFVERNRVILFAVIAVVSVVVGTVLSQLAGQQPIRAIVAINEAAQKVAKGDFGVRLAENIPIAELREMSENFNIMVRELAGIELLRIDFTENVSHEFKTPLSAIEGYATLLQKPGLGEEKREEYIKKILVNTRRLSNLSSNILLLSGLENREIEIPKELFCLDEQLREVILSLEDQWVEKSLELEIDLDSADYAGSRDLLLHVWQNILGNAVKFTPLGGIIRVRLRQEPNGIRITVTDTGPGMTKEVQGRVFEKFYQGDRSHSAQGNGLGLTLAKRIVDLHGGTILVDSTEGEGTTFTVFLPL